MDGNTLVTILYCQAWQTMALCQDYQSFNVFYGCVHIPCNLGLYAHWHGACICNLRANWMLCKDYQAMTLMSQEISM